MRLLNLALDYIIAYVVFMHFNTVLLQHPKRCLCTDTSTKRPRMGNSNGEFLKHEGNQKWLLAVIITVNDPARITPHWCTAWTRLWRLFVQRSSATLAFCATAFLQKVVKMPKGSCRQITALHMSPQGEVSMESVQGKTVSCFCNQEDVTIDSFCSR